MPSNDNDRVFDSKVAMKLLDPRGGGIPLVPLADVEQHHSTFFWAAVFFGIFAGIVGSLISLLTTAYTNMPVIYILGMFLLSYFVFFVVFTVRGFLKWKSLRAKSLGPESWHKESLGERVGALERTVQLLKLHRDLGTYVFNGVYSLEFDEFNKRLDELLPLEKDDPRRKKLNQRLMMEGIISVDKSDADSWVVNYENNFDVTM
ncbi:hypothetical protein ACFL6Q_01865 [Candidatus Neomarinimicrobiota bacterium]